MHVSTSDLPPKCEAMRIAGLMPTLSVHALVAMGNTVLLLLCLLLSNCLPRSGFSLYAPGPGHPLFPTLGRCIPVPKLYSRRDVSEYAASLAGHALLVSPVLMWNVMLSSVCS